MNFYGQIQAIQQSIKDSQQICLMQAEILVKNFRIERTALQAEYLRARQEQDYSLSTRKKQLWSPLNLFSRFHNQSLQIFWQLVNHDRGARTTKYRYLSMKDSRYDMRTLLGHAHAFEKDLVSEYEEEAFMQRQRWQHLMEARRHASRMLKIHDFETRYQKRCREVLETQKPQRPQQVVWVREE